MGRRGDGSLKDGVGRFGWSYMKDDNGLPLEDADLNRLKSKIASTGWEKLTWDEQDRYQSFLLELHDGDYVVYINVPQWGVHAWVTVPYYWKHIDDDFNHCFPVDPRSIRDFDRNSGIVHPALSTRLKLQGKHWRIYAENDFESLLAGLDAGKHPAGSNASDKCEAAWSRG